MSLKTIFAAMVLGLALLSLGCGGGTPPPKVKADKKEASNPHNYKGRDWCVEHGVPESKCSLCDEKYAAECKKKGDWCDKHDRAKSHCFICKPELQKEFAANYKAKYGEDPPPMKEDK